MGDFERTLPELGTVHIDLNFDETPLTRERALAVRALVHDGDYFAILGVGREATALEVRGAWQRMRDQFRGDRVSQGLREELGISLGEMIEVLDEACRVLADEELRRDYSRHLAR